MSLVIWLRHTSSNDQCVLALSLCLSSLLGSQHLLAAILSSAGSQTGVASSGVTMSQWIGLREKLQETMVFSFYHQI